ncbi:DUF4398 domain-containing protein [Anaeromyxobacter oryzisoli]|uniref:DUF4398 domain-containing protein n=1 Tax=Anaeromyxobacter oryzisoli TaxID=2925408 RepID=UPI001F55C589|nr:DUF4398 domain-containing protein [Anaeromyxobacter sp. SG63]
MRLLKALPVTALALLAGCGPIRSTGAIVDADVALEAARAAGAETTAAYEYSAAEVYLHQARELQGRSEYEASARYAQKAGGLAKTARQKSLDGTNKVEESP